MLRVDAVNVKEISCLTFEGRNLEDLCRKYAGNLPRYTSYPTALEFQEVSRPSVAESALAEVASDGVPLSLYVHIPFCESLCYFCACNKIITQDESLKEEYLELLKAELGLIQESYGGIPPISQVHLGGGSPSYLSTNQLQRLCDILESHLEILPNAEKSIEADPRTFDRDKAALLYSRGFTRVSLGVQDFDPMVQDIVNRRQPYEMTVDAISYLNEIGFNGINLDLIYGLPGQTITSFRSTIERLIGIKPDRIAMYGYAHVKWKVKVQHVLRKHGVPGPLERISLFVMAVEMLTDAGYDYIGLDHFAMPDDELSQACKEKRLRRNFMGYTTIKGGGVLGLGLSSISDLSGVIYQNFSDLGSYRNMLGKKVLPVRRAIERTWEDKVRASIIENIMCNRGVSLKDLISVY
ncbi:MAG: oxygen-independent coproporphyrinogen III oxidase, partial [Candidatus Dadabacteria bacterium]